MACQNNLDSCLSPLELKNAKLVGDLLEDCSWSCCTCKTHLFKGVFENESVYFSETSGPLCDIIQSVSIRDCSGNVIKTYDGSEHLDFLIQVTERELLIECD